ncbi:MAG: GNAT family N-acetyltransferase [Anaerocolumna aminovalerica]|uniref:GNAT family N-acetyltransferase n=1 Tax=Anaerocolumna aminovalerica TaxID=1527 RepID=UPI001C0EB38C|nr:GNAT family N-acetyltransferase [Anaerocolumna aminovalerica]MBU5333044.1 GNAT family N-acetyltransferase [Anaerocolumna aminovalerica]MDU6264590.1 GNAT family N-acetyltransferase [Anaerocolumna aminovalerica]
MNITFRTYKKEDIPFLKDIWNDILIGGVAFPGEVLYEEQTFEKMLEEQSAVTCILVNNEVAGYFILHPNNIGRCSHVANASYAISKEYRGRKLAEPLVKKSLEQAKELGFRGMQFNAVVTGNIAAIHTYQKAGFKIIGTIPQGFRLKNGVYSDMHIMYIPLI